MKNDSINVRSVGFWTMNEFDFKNFDNFYSKEVEPILINLEEERKRVRFSYIKSLIFFTPVVVCFWIIPIAIFYAIGSVIVSYKMFLPIILCCCIVLSPLFYYLHKALRVIAIQLKILYIKDLKNKVYTKIFKILNINFEVITNNNNEYKMLVKKILQHANNNKKIKVSIQFDDYFSGEYCNIKYDLWDIKLNCQQEFFNGLLLAVKINKKFDKETVVKSNNFELFNINCENVKLEDIEFPKHFKVYTDDQVEARYLLTPSFAERLKNYHKSKNDKTIIFFDSKISNDSNMFILTNTGKDNFEIPFNKSILNKQYYYNLIRELINMLEIASALKLEQNICL